MKKILIIFFFSIFIAILTGCLKTATYSEAGYNEALILKQETIELLAKATEPYASHEAEITDLLQKLNTAYENSKARAHNEISAKQWETMIDENANLAAGFFARWKSEGTLNEFFISEAKVIIANSYDAIINLEKEKKR